MLAGTRTLSNDAMTVRVNGALVRKLREQRKLTQQRFADKVGIGIRTLGRIEGESPAVQEEIVAAIAGFFDVETIALTIQEPEAAVSHTDVGKLAKIERAAGKAMPQHEDGGRVMTAAALKELMSLYGTMHHAPYVLRGRVEEYRAISEMECDVLATKPGYASRFLIEVPARRRKRCMIAGEVRESDGTRGTS